LRYPFNISLLDGSRFGLVGFVCLVLFVVIPSGGLKLSSNKVFELWGGINASLKTEENMYETSWDMGS
jgi:hypothetical protein